MQLNNKIWKKQIYKEINKKLIKPQLMLEVFSELLVCNFIESHNKISTYQTKHIYLPNSVNEMIYLFLKISIFGTSLGSKLIFNHILQSTLSW